MLTCDCGFWRTHQEGVTEKELAAIMERAKKLRVTLVSDNGVTQIFRVEGGEAIHYVVLYPDGGKENSGSAYSLANCKHLIAVRSFLDGQVQNLFEVVGIEGCGEDFETDLPCQVSAVG